MGKLQLLQFAYITLSRQVIRAPSSSVEARLVLHGSQTVARDIWGILILNADWSMMMS